MRIPILFADDLIPEAIEWDRATGKFRRIDNGEEGELHALVRAWCRDDIVANHDDPDDEINDEYIEEAVRWTDAWWCGDERVGREYRILMRREDR